MLVTEKYFRFYAVNGALSVRPNWQALDPTTDRIVVSVYRCNDFYLTDVIQSSSVTFDGNVFIPLSDGCYTITVDITCRSDCQVHKDYHKQYIYNVSFVAEALNNLLPEIEEYLCQCSKCSLKYLDTCDNCKDVDVCHNELALFLYLEAIVNAFQDRTIIYGLYEYLREVFKGDYDSVLKSIKDSLARGYVRGQFEVDRQIMYKYILSIYIFLMMSEIFNSGSYFDTNLSDYDTILSRYRYTKISTCASKKGHNTSQYVRAFSDIVYKADYFTIEENCQDIALCDHLNQFVQSYMNFRFNKSQLEQEGVKVTQEGNNYLIFVIPKTYGIPKAVYNEMLLDVSDQFDRLDYDKFFIMKSKEPYLDLDNSLFKFKF